jgi:tetratricopeptide (TPR) repeat protein
VDKEKILAIAQKYILKGQSKRAIKEYLKLIEASPKDKRLYLKLGDLYLKDGEKEKAIQEYMKLADLYSEEDLNSRAISVYKKILSIDPKLIDAFHKIAKLYLREGLVGSARNYYQNILEIEPRDSEAAKAIEGIENYMQPKHAPSPTREEPISPMARPARKFGDERPAPAAFLPPAHVSPSTPVETGDPVKDSETHYHLGIAYKEMELFDYAISEFELASSSPSMRFDCLIMLGNCFMEKGDYERSIASFKAATKLKGLPDEKLAKLQFNLGLAYEANGMVSDAITAFKQVLSLDHSFSEAHDKIRKLQNHPG